MVSSITTLPSPCFPMYELQGKTQLPLSSLTEPEATPPLIVSTPSLIFQSHVPHLPELTVSVCGSSVPSYTSAVISCSYFAESIP